MVSSFPATLPLSVRLLKLILFYAISTSFILLCLEALLRLFGDGVYQSQPYHIQSDPKPALIGHHSFGFALAPGRFKVNLNEKLQFEAKHTADSNRITDFASNDTTGAPEIWIYGCSFTYGWGLDDTASFPFKVQTALPKFNVINKGVPGHGTVQHLMRLKREINITQKPALVVLCYGSFHDDRNVLSYQQRRFFKRAMFSENKKTQLENVRLPFVNVSRPEAIHFEQITSLYSPWSLSRKSALANFVEIKWLGIKDRYSDMEEASLYLMSQMHHITKDNKTEFLVAGILQNDKTGEMLEMLDEKKINTIDISVNTLDPKYTLAPYDDHPNSKATQGYKNTLVRYIRKNYIAAAKQ